MTARDIAALFEDLELRLIASLKRNLAHHKAQEQTEGGKNGVPEHWPAWQAEKLRSLDRFRRENRAIMGAYTDKIDAETRALMRQQFAEADGSEGAFFGINGRKLDALIDEITHSEARVEKAALRYMDDIYRKTILRAAASMAAGGMTLQQATDLAVQDFLTRGISCVRYRNGRRVNIATYAEMALRTNSTRAMLLGEAQLRERLGIDTVLCSQYGGCSETCLPWQGLVYIDDVWQPYRGSGTNFGGTYGYSRNGRSYPLLSVAVKAGLFHPNCRHHLTTWIEGVSVRPEPMDKAKVERTAKLEKQQRYLETQVRLWKRLAEGTQDPAKAAEYQRKVRAAQRKVKAFVDAHDDVLRRDYWREQAYPAMTGRTYQDRTFQVHELAPERVPLARWEGLSEQQAQNLQAAHKALLRFLQGGDPAREAGGYLDKDFKLISAHEGAAGEVELRTPPVGAIGSVHTHPSGETFSLMDVSNFTMHVELGIMTVVGNNGNVYVLEKDEDRLDIAGLSHFLKEVSERQPAGYLNTPELYIAFMEEFLHGVEPFGIRYRNCRAR